MHPIAVCADAALRQHVHPALRLQELVDLIAGRVDRTLDAARLRSILAIYPESFRLLDPWHGRWTIAADPDQDEPDLCIDVWVVGVSEGAPPPGAPTALRLRESVRWLARGVDPRSPTDVGRWYAIALADRALRDAVRQAA